MIPYRVKQIFRQQRLRRYLNIARSLPHVQLCDRDPDAEVHMMLGKYDLYRALAALYTFFHCYGDVSKLGLVLHLDGTVRRAQRRTLEQHFPKARVFDHPVVEGPIVDILANRSASTSYYDTPVGCCQKLFEPAATARADKIIAIDTDVAFFDRPDAIVDWVANDTPQALFILEGPARGQPAPHVEQEITRVLDDLAKRHGPLNLQSYFFNAGVLCYRALDMRWDLVEDVLDWHRNLGEQPPGHWFCDWNIDQTVFMINYAAWPDATWLNETDYRCGAEPASVCNHFLSPNYHKSECLQRIRDQLLQITS